MQPRKLRHNEYVYFALIMTVAIYLYHHDRNDFWSGVYGFLVWLLIFGLAYLFIFAFTRRIVPPLDIETTSADEREIETGFERLLLTLRAGYLFMIFTIGICIVPFIVPSAFFHDGKVQKYENSPFLIAVGCIEVESAQLPLSCENTGSAPQWLVGLGASNQPVLSSSAVSSLRANLVDVSVSADVAVASIGLEERDDKRLEAGSALKSSLDDFLPEFESFKARANKLEIVQNLVARAVEEIEVTVIYTNLPEGELVGKSKELQAAAVRAEAALETLQEALQQHQHHVRLTGGLVVPLFVVVLSLLGGSISMTRKLPEIQLRAAPAYRKTYKARIGEFEDHGLKRPISALEARDFLLFQILQVMTAPFLAMVIFASIEPESTVSAVVIGFGAGFASEPLLLRLRRMIDQLAGLSFEAQTDSAQADQEAAPDEEPPATAPDPGHAAANAVSAARNSDS
ncbi:hypothetical protein [Leisingera sp. M658]|uniref:hypothetical protein n=1 Tax=Leisingera sp. M658 TaxID=2867015 RepID=UPI0021A3750B|nr:hypothetical protein [Leisingera sp. M658]UWQ74407.1 hypothetical protein K3724_18285 [Leisingera sp. M658]